MLKYEIVLRLSLAFIIGFFVGFEREHRHRPAGIKTHVLVCIGAALISILQSKMVDDIIAQVAEKPELAAVLKSDYGRLGAQVISGIGFLGAGTILRTKGSIKGLTTAATLWTVACIGLAVGMGYYFMSIVAFLFVVVIMTILKAFQDNLQYKRGSKQLELRILNKKETMERIEDYFEDKKINIDSIEFCDDEENKSVDRGYRCLYYTIVLPRTLRVNQVIRDLGVEDNILAISEIVND